VDPGSLLEPLVEDGVRLLLITAPGDVRICVL
jgi:hypothetical protein